MIFPRNRPIVDKYPVVIRWIYAVALPTILVIAFLGAIAITIASGADPKQGRADMLVTVTIRGIVVAGFVLALYLLFAARRDGIRAAIARRPFISVTAAIGLLFGLGKSLSDVVPKVVAVIVAVSSILLPCLILLSFPIVACVALVRSYRSSNLEEKRQVAWPLWGLVIAITGKILGNVITFGTVAYLAMTHRDFITWRGFFEIVGTVPTIITLVIPVSFAVAILKYRLMNIDVIIRKTVAYAILSGAIIVLYLGLVGGLGTLLVNAAGVRDQTMVIVSTLLVALIVVPLRNRLQTLVDRNLFRHKYDYPAALRAISAETLTATDIGAFLSSAAEKMQQSLQNRAVVIFTIRHDEFVAAAKVGVADALVGTLRFAKEWMLPHLDRALDPREHELPVAAATALRKIEAVLVVPVNAPGTPPNGFIALAAKLNDAPFEVEDVDFVRSVADQLDLGIDRIHSQREEADFAQARAIQQTLLPREMPRVAKLDVSGIWQPARTMGGDYYDLIPLSDTELAVCIGDVAGKGMTAALTMSGLQAAVRASASSSPRDLCERVRRVVVSSLSGGRFVTFFYATLDTANMRLRWCNAGHNAPILARADGTIVRLAEGGPALSRLMLGAAFSEQEIDLRPGDRIVLFTDGVSEAIDSAGEMFDEHRIEELVADSEGLAALELQETILDAATTHSGGELADDLTLVVLRVAE
jgi:serine phosphatase RsbU (regulator of sigma subunit)